MKIDDVVDFDALDENGEPVKLSDFRGKPVVLFFYPKADTPGCTIEACEFRDSFGDLKKAGVTVLGISRDKPGAQKKFKEKFDLPYTLLADPEQVVCKQFDVIKNKTMYGKPVTGIERSTFLFDKDGKLVEEMRKVTPEGHAAEILSKFKK
ncbi:MAG: peroxiredoxin [Acidobacteria bacterium]|nr:peroxiredoxin [Acidobacteriota bacterium]